MRIVVFTVCLLMLFSCENNSLSKQIQLERQRQDSLSLIDGEIKAKQESVEMLAIEETDRMKKELDEAEKSDQVRIKKEAEETRKYRAELEAESKASTNKYRQLEKQYLSQQEKGPQWLDGTWSITTTNYNPFNGQSSTIKSVIAIDWEYQNLTCLIGKEVIESGRYTVSDGAIHCGSSYWEIDEVNRRLGFGKGKYYTKN